MLLVLDGGACEVGIESTIVDCTRGVPVLLRPGAITRDDIERACGTRPLSKEELPAQTPRASGTLLAHYAPNAKVRLMEAGNCRQRSGGAGRGGQKHCRLPPQPAEDGRRRHPSAPHAR